jgi:DNA modification methylase
LIPILTAKQGNNSDLFKDVLSLYAKDNDKILDMTYGLGTFWKKTDVSKYQLICNDLDSKRGNAHFDFRNMPYEDKSFDIIVLDPPYGNRSSNKNGFVASLYNNDFHNLNTIEDILNFYIDGMKESHRLLDKNGYLMVKCMDEISGGKQKRNHISIWQEALNIGFEDEDLFILVQNNVPVMRHDYQLHARKNNSFLWIFKKR